MLQTLRHYNGQPAFDAKLNYLISEDSIRKSATRNGYVRSHQIEIRQHKGLVDKFGQFIIELSALSEFLLPNGMFVEYFAHRDLVDYRPQLEALAAEGLIDLVDPDSVEARTVTESEYVAVMRAIWEYLGRKPILWVSHFNADAPEKVQRARQQSIDWVRRGAQETGGFFFDPTQVVQQLGQGAALKDNGTDLAHFTEAATEALAGVYDSWIDSLRRPRIEDFRSTAVGSRI
ncbi:hypothetical protein HTY52_12820 [Cupriavidus taiwanensis]|uniref:hypothetical protein n=1 Tax=Cupriavidus taiwanensis TaxID=164546 RepID=UPI001571C81A|nr:hypothetical protein [Cupriavidus taiwanensis]NSX14958.1 hypothetical protein [Cupriavidus taiwanensis]